MTKLTDVTDEFWYDPTYRNPDDSNIVQLCDLGEGGSLLAVSKSGKVFVATMNHSAKELRLTPLKTVMCYD